VFLSLVLAGALTTGSAVRAEVATHGDDDTSDRPIVVLEVNRITDGDTPWGGFWEPLSDPSERIHVLNHDGMSNEDGRPSIVLHPQTRTPIAAWPRRTEAGYEIVVSRFADSTWTDPTIVASGDGDALDAHLTVDPASGDVHLLYRSGLTSPRVEHRKASASAMDWSIATVVSAPGETAVRPSATWHAGDLVVVYESHLGGLETPSRQIVVALQDGDTWLGQVLTGVEYDRPNEPQVHSDGTRVWIDWIDGPDVMRWTSRGTDGTWAPLESEPFAGTEDREYHVRGRVKRTVREQN